MQLQFLNKHDLNNPATMQPRQLQLRPLVANNNNNSINTVNNNIINTVNNRHQIVRNPGKPIEDPVKSKKLLWGEPIWYLFHTLAQKVHEDTFPEIRQELLTIISTICNNLPCPDCANHATRYINSLNLNTIQTKRDLINMLYQFHNSVNARKNLQQFPYADLEPKYSAAVTVNIIQYFMQAFNKPNYSGRISVNNFHKTRFIAQLKVFFSTKLTYFDP
jgi:hypothetical protein